MTRRLALACVLAASLAPPALAEEVVVFAASSMKTALDAVAAGFQDSTGHQVTISYAGSGQLARQIIQGAPADIFVSAAVNWMDAVEQDGLIAAGTRRDLFGNTLVLVAHGQDAAPVTIGPDLDLPGLLGEEKLAMARVDSVPAGQYGKAALAHLGLWDAIAPSVAQADNARAALALVATGEAPYGIVFATDTAATENVTVVATFPADSHPPIIYPGALLTNAADAADRAFFEALMSDLGDATFAAQGFAILN
ncbi:molybdate ABC transporter substrate-binding protein [Phaeovulum sp. NW3]|uniref:molybdate ABC transporter substrate-binding protein n=1 Tax=Phaeovulum sp. NW3 TaxID=2934933 RepID=UPI002021BA86|nr:molybdate ABC transporter substrate-binding protein [Phaeovulum sp. NW3]MCL7465681.1 molybdate ABC transporter substrate-binding protein [Phaeovulum sp. NW3]